MMREPVLAIIALGGNLGDREASIRSAVRRLAGIDGVTVERVSGLYESDALRPDGVDTEAPAYLNAVAIIRTTLDPRRLLDSMHKVEDAHGRVREERWGDRTLDLDLIAYGTLSIQEHDLTVPHPEASTRAFVLAPWLEIDPLAELPGAGSVAGLLGATGEQPRLFRRWNE